MISSGLSLDEGGNCVLPVVSASKPPLFVKADIVEKKDLSLDPDSLSVRIKIPTDLMFGVVSAFKPPLILS